VGCSLPNAATASGEPSILEGSGLHLRWIVKRTVGRSAGVVVVLLVLIRCRRPVPAGNAVTVRLISRDDRDHAGGTVRDCFGPGVTFEMQARQPERQVELRVADPRAVPVDEDRPAVRAKAQIVAAHVEVTQRVSLHAKPDLRVGGLRAVR
jgi:hypothetical protein